TPTEQRGATAQRVPRRDAQLSVRAEIHRSRRGFRRVWRPCSGRLRRRRFFSTWLCRSSRDAIGTVRLDQQSLTAVGTGERAAEKQRSVLQPQRSLTVWTLEANDGHLPRSRFVVRRRAVCRRALAMNHGSGKTFRLSFSAKSLVVINAVFLASSMTRTIGTFSFSYLLRMPAIPSRPVTLPSFRFCSMFLVKPAALRASPLMSMVTLHSSAMNLNASCSGVLVNSISTLAFKRSATKSGNFAAVSFGLS